MLTTDWIAQQKRVVLLHAEARNLRSEADRLGAADVVHDVHNCVMTAQGALHIADARLADGRADDLDELLDLAERRMREAHALIARSRLARFPMRRPTLAAA